MERLLEDISFTAPDQPPGTKVTITAEMVRERVGTLAKKADLAKYIL
jgi:ATP-dependent HslUV protease ATP-binding subunit HslU